jgi:hypothetical protein
MRRLALAIAFLTPVMAYAQPGSPARRGNPAQGAAALATSSGLSTGPGFASVTAGIKGAPFSAETVTETTRSLANGNRIDGTVHGNVYRDSEGRTRHETSTPVPNQEDGLDVSITDPVRQVIIHFATYGDKVATVTPMHPSSTASATRPVTSGNATSSTAAGRTSQPTPSTREDLGTQEIDGFTVRGTRTTRTTEAGKIGNEQPIVSVTELWYSKELHEMLLTETDDPLSGHRTSKLVNIQRAEPDATLFQVPPDYTVKEQ